MNKLKIERKNARNRHENTRVAMEACRGCRAIVAYAKRFNPETRRRMIAAAAVLLE